MKRRIILVVVFALLAALIGGFGYFQFVIKPAMIKKIIASGSRPPATVSTETAKLESWLPKLPAIGTLRAVQGVEVSSEVGGIVTAINFDSGKFVKKGDLLVQLDDSVEQADLRSGQAQLKKAELELSRQSELLRRSNTAKTSFDAALAARDTAVATVDRTKALIAQKAIRAAFDGQLGIRNVDLGQYVSPGTAMVSLQQLTPIFVDFPMPEQALNKLAIGQTVEVALDADPGHIFKGAIESIDSKVNQATRNVLVRARVDNTEARLLPGMFANVNVIAGKAEQVVTVPRTAVTYSLYGDSVFVVVEAPKPAGEAAAQTAGQTAAQTEKSQAPELIVDRRFVRVGEARGDRVAILEGVKAGDNVVISGQIKLQPHARVHIDNSDLLKPPAKRPLE